MGSYDQSLSVADYPRSQFDAAGPWVFPLSDGRTLTVRIATASADDAAAIWQITTDAYREHRGILDPANGSDTETPASVSSQISAGSALIALLEDVPAASLRVTFEPEFLYIGRVGVSPSCRRLGIGRLLMHCAHAAALSAGIASTRLGTRAQLQGNIDFYLSLGYVITSKRQHPLGTDDVIIFTRQLCASDALP